MATGRPPGKNKVRRGRWADDPLVPIYGAHVAAALELRELSVNAAAEKLGKAHPQQTLNSIVQGKTTRCRASRRAALARLLRVPAGWLSGTEPLDDVPGYNVRRIQNAGGVPDVLVFTVPGESLPRWRFENAGPILPPRVQLEARDTVKGLRYLFDPRLFDWRLPKPASRVPEQVTGDGLKAMEQPLPPEADALRDVAALPDDVLALLSLERWRTALYGEQLGSWHATPEESDAFAVAMGKALRLLMKPALRGAAQFDVPARRAAFAAQQWIARQLGGT